MAQRTYTACDACAAEDVDAVGTPRGPFQGWTVDLCDGHWDELAKPLMVIAQGRGTHTNGAGPAPKLAAERVDTTDAHEWTEKTCPLCWYVGPTLPALGMHFRQIHGT